MNPRASWPNFWNKLDSKKSIWGSWAKNGTMDEPMEMVGQGHGIGDELDQLNNAWMLGRL